MGKTAVVSDNIKDRIFVIRGKQVIIDYDLAELYAVPTKALNQAVKRNLERFPDHFMFQLTEKEVEFLRSQNVTSNTIWSKRRFLPYVFTEQGVSMLSAVLKSKKAIEVSIQIIDAFVAMRKFLANNAQIFQRLDRTEMKLLEHDERINELFRTFESAEPQQGIFYDGQVFDAYKFVAGLVRKAKKKIILIDNYVDESVLVLFSKRKKGVSVTIYTRITKQLRLDLERFNAQYEPIIVKEFGKSHDRFLIIDEEVYHFGASLKDLGKKWFAFAKMKKESLEMLRRMG